MKNLLLAGCLIVSTNLLSQDFNRSKMDSLLALIEENQKGMGSVSIFQDGEEVYQKAFGYASLDPEVEASQETKYRIGSISKTFTAAIIMKLVEEGALTLDTKLSEFYPDIVNAEEITVEQMLRHRSGIYNFTSSEDYTSWMEEPATREEIVGRIEELGSVFEPGEKFEYSNSNYVLLSYIAEQLEEKDFADIIEERIVQSCDLSDTYYGNEIDVSDQEAQSYTNPGEWELATETDMSVPSGAGAIVSTPTDLNRFLNCLFSEEIVTASSLEQMKDLQDNYGLGLFEVPFYDKKALGHSGGIDGFQSNAFYFPNEKVSVAYLSNGVVMALNDVLIGVLSIYFGKEYQLPEFQPAMELDADELDQFLGVYSSPQFPIKLTITKKGNVLIGQGTGQPEFQMEAIEPTRFRFEPAGLEIEFMPDDDKLILNQGGGKFELTRE